MTYHRTIIVGNLGADPEIRDVGRDTVCNFRICVNERWRDRDDRDQEKQYWYRVAVWGKQAEACHKYLRKGRMVLVEANGVEAHAYEDKEGRPAASIEVRARRVQFLGGGDGDREGRGRDDNHDRWKSSVGRDRDRDRDRGRGEDNRERGDRKRRERSDRRASRRSGRDGHDADRGRREREQYDDGDDGNDVPF